MYGAICPRRPSQVALCERCARSRRRHQPRSRRPHRRPGIRTDRRRRIAEIPRCRNASRRAPASRGSTQPRQDLRLTSAELRILSFLPTDRSLQEIADRLYLSRPTIKPMLHRSTTSSASRADPKPSSASTGSVSDQQPPSPRARRPASDSCCLAKVTGWGDGSLTRAAESVVTMTSTDASAPSPGSFLKWRRSRQTIRPNAL
jgi:hypothetical protein